MARTPSLARKSPAGGTRKEVSRGTTCSRVWKATSASVSGETNSSTPYYCWTGSERARQLREPRALLWSLKVGPSPSLSPFRESIQQSREYLSRVTPHLLSHHFSRSFGLFSEGAGEHSDKGTNNHGVARRHERHSLIFLLCGILMIPFLRTNSSLSPFLRFYLDPGLGGLLFLSIMP